MQQSSQAETTSALTLPESNVLATSQEAQASKNTQAPSALSGNRFLIILSLVALYFLWGTTYLAMRIGLLGFPPFLMAGTRFLFAGKTLYYRFAGRRLRRPPRATLFGCPSFGELLVAICNCGILS